MNIFKSAKELLDSIAVEQCRIKKFRLCDWEDPLDIAEYKKEKRIEERWSVIKRFSINNRCPTCLRLIMDVRSWIISKDKTAVICKSCFKRVKSNQPLDHLKIVEEKLFSICKYEIDGRLLSKVRDEAGISIREFARRVGWSRSYQQKLEAGDLKNVSIENAEFILQVLSEANIMTLDKLEDQNEV